MSLLLPDNGVVVSGGGIKGDKWENAGEESEGGGGDRRLQDRGLSI